jgi:hypothetical protein
MANVAVMEILYAVPCEACFAIEGCMTAKGIFTTLLKESPGIILVWVKLK